MGDKGDTGTHGSWRRGCVAAAVAGLVVTSTLVTSGSPAHAARDDTVLAFGSARFVGSTSSVPGARPRTMTPTPSGDGYWLAGSDGGVFAFGDARFHGSTGAIRLNRPVVGMAATPTGNGYWIVASDGGIFAFGDARFHGSTGAIRLNRPVVGMAATPTGNGYWLVASDGGIFAFGDARFRGSGATVARAPVVGIARTPTGNGYWLATSDGAVLAFGDAGDHGGASGALGRRHVVALAAEPGGGGYWLLVGPALETPLGPGATGLAVADLQHELEARRYFVGTRDGVYGLTTSQAVTAVQKVWGLPRTAVFDAATRDALLRGTPPAPLGGDLAFVDLARQVTFIVRQGQTEWVLNVSTGAPSTPTRPGSWMLYRADGGRTASCNGCLYRPRFFDGGRAFHGYVSVPTYPASHGCVRVTNAAMDLLWAENLLPMGSRVVVA